MKAKYLATLAALTLAGGLQAQDIYKVEMLSGNDLNGTARYVGMGGAMGALGADLSAMGNNPAAIGLYRKSDVAMTGSMTVQPNGMMMSDVDKARASFDQMGFVYSVKSGGENLRFLNFGFNYQKRRNLKNYIGLDNVRTSDGLSQSWQMFQLAGGFDNPIDLAPDAGNDMMTTPLTIAGYETQMIAPIYDDEGNFVGYNPSYADRYNYHRVQWGGINEYDFNIAFNYRDRIYGGLTLGVYNVEMRGRTEYDELLIGETDPVTNVTETAPYNLTQEENIYGTGYDLKLGLIFRPIDSSPFRIGFSFATPTFYNLTHNTALHLSSPYGYEDTETGDVYDRSNYTLDTSADYKIRTPWRFNLSMATTFGNYLALGAEYEIAQGKSAQVRYPDMYDGYTDRYETATRDQALDAEIDKYLCPQHTVRLGAEVRLAKGLYTRLGYNYVSAPMKDNAFLDLFTESPSYRVSTSTDYVNLGAINRVTAGLGYRGKRFYADFAYQFQRQQGDVYAFHYTESENLKNVLTGQKVDLNRHNAMLTIGIKF